MATTQVLKLAHNVDDKVTGIDEKVTGVDDKVKAVIEGTQSDSSLRLS
jgi:hypothetical protein